MGIGFKGGFAAFMDGYNKGEEQRHQRERQAKEDAWLQSQRDIKTKEQERDEKLRTDLLEAQKDKTTSVEQQGPLMQEQGVDVPLPNINQTRPQTDEELRRSLAGAYRKAGKFDQAFSLEDSAKKLGMQDYATKFNQFRTVAQDMPLKDQVAQAIQIFNDSPNAGTISTPRFDANGAVTFDAYNKVTGQKVTKTFSDPKKFIDDMHSYYNQSSWLQEDAMRRAAEVKRQEELAKVHAVAPGVELRTGAGGLVAKNNTLTTAEARANGLGGRGSGGGQSAGQPQQDRPDYSQGVAFKDLYNKNLAFKLDQLKVDPVTGGTPPTPKQIDQASKDALAMTTTQMRDIQSGTQKQTQEGVIHQVLKPLLSGRGADPSKYAGVRAQLIDRGYSDAALTAMGYPPPANAASTFKDGKMISRGTYAR